MQINRKCGLACETNYLSARYTLTGFGPTQHGPNSRVARKAQGMY